MLRLLAFSILACGALSGCTTSEVVVAHTVPLVPAQETIPEDQLLDVGVVVFDPGVPEGEIDKDVLEELLKDGTFVHIRRTESYYMAVELRDAMQKSGNWGAVWVTPKSSPAADLNVSARILHSDGDYVRLTVKAVDGTGRVWLDKPYELETAAGAFNRQRYPDLDPYQDVFNSIANDLAAAREDLSAGDTRQIRTVSSLKYAGNLSPEAFAGYVEEDRDGTFEAVRLPAADDPQFVRTQQARQREQLFFATLDQHYEKFAVDATDSYDSWREYAREEAIAIRELTRSARWRTGIGIATILASIVYGADSDNDSFSNRLIRDATMYVGVDLLQSNAVRKQEKQLHIETLEELSTSFEDEVTPLVVEVAGVQHRLTGTAAVQYAEWQDLLKQLYISETGFVPEDVEIYAEPEPVPAVEDAATGAGAEVPADATTTAAPGDATAVPAPATEETPADAAETTPQPNNDGSSAPATPATEPAGVQLESADASGGSASGV
ncbi:MAG TPA: hypothetical protein VIC71_02795 [Gammaproteobacteria bacterium]